MTSELWAGVGLLVVAAIIVTTIILVKRRPRKLDRRKFAKDWAALQKLCADKSNWSQAVVQADDLLDLALRKKGVRGKSTGERMVHIQRQFTDNDSTWFGHKLRRQIDAEPQKRLTQKEVKNALFGIRQALKDIGALPNGKSGKK